MTAPDLQKLFDACCEEVERVPKEKEGVRSEVVLIVTPAMREQLERRQMRKVKP